MDIPANGFVIRGQGSTLNFVNSLKPGDVVTFDIRVYMSGQEVNPFTMISSVPKILENGEVLETEYIMNQFSSGQPLTVMGYSQDETKILMAVRLSQVAHAPPRVPTCSANWAHGKA